MKFLLILFLISCLLGCANPATTSLAFPNETLNNIEWSEQEKSKEIAVKTLYRGENSSAHLVRLNGKEFPHFHDRHDLSVTVLSGTSAINFKERRVVLKPGDVASIPKGTYHWAEKAGDDASVVYIVFSPAFDGKDRRRAE